MRVHMYAVNRSFTREPLDVETWNESFNGARLSGLWDRPVGVFVVSNGAAQGLKKP